MKLFVLRTGVTGPVGYNNAQGSIPTWISGTPVGQGTVTRNFVFDLGTEWSKIDFISVELRTVAAGMTGTPGGLRSHCNSEAALPAPSNARLQAAWNGAGTQSFTYSTGVSGNSLSTYLPTGRYYIAVLDNSGSTGTLGAGSFVEVTAWNRK